LQDFFKDETVFVAYGAERCSMDDFELSSNGKQFAKKILFFLAKPSNSLEWTQQNSRFFLLFNFIDWAKSSGFWQTINRLHRTTLLCFMLFTTILRGK